MPLGLTERDFDLLHLIGQGAFGKVFTARNRDTGQVYALKVPAHAPVAAEEGWRDAGDHEASTAHSTRLHMV